MKQLLAVVVLVLAFSGLGLAQIISGSIVGQVADASGASGKIYGGSGSRVIQLGAKFSF